MKDRKLYIRAAEQISMQQPLCEEWLYSPIIYNNVGLVHAVEARYKDFIPPMEARRMAPIMKRAIATSLKALSKAGMEHPDAIITGTSIGSLDFTERFLDSMIANDEELLKPTHFMQSTHNTVGSALGIYTKSYGYNATYSHGEISFELALQDAQTQVRLGRINTALVGGFDEMVDSYYKLLCKTGYVGRSGMCACGEVSVSVVLNTEKNGENLCEIVGVDVSHRLYADDIAERIDKFLYSCGVTTNDISAVVTGVNGNENNDKHYRIFEDCIFSCTPLLNYKQMFGENYTASAFGVYVAAHCLKKGYVPELMYYRNRPIQALKPKSILLINQRNGKDYSLVLLRKL